MADNRAIGIFDSGLGGLTVVREIISRLPKENIIYFGDTGRVPYGTRSLETIRKYALQDEMFLLKHDVKLIIAACGTVSSVAADTAANLPVPFFEVVSHAVDMAVKTTRNKKIGIVGTAATIRSNAHKSQILRIMPQAKVTACSCSLFVPFVEEGWYDENDDVVIGMVSRYLQPMIDAGVDTLILGCTHYPILEPAIRKVMGDNVSLINAGTAAAESVKSYLMATNAAADENNIASHQFYVSDKAQSFRTTASILLGEEIDEQKVEQVDIDQL